jgi:hypothetical protein
VRACGQLSRGALEGLGVSTLAVQHEGLLSTVGSPYGRLRRLVHGDHSPRVGNAGALTRGCLSRLPGAPTPADREAGQEAGQETGHETDSENEDAGNE